MGTAKRERQKANRQQRLEELAREARRTTVKRRGLRIGIGVVAALVALFVIAQLVGDDEAAAPATTAAPDTTVSPDTTVASETTAPSDTSAPETTAPESTTTTVAEFVYGSAPCPAEDGTTEMPESFDGAPELCIDPDATYTAEVVTNRGSFTIELNTAGAPGNVNNFVSLARYGYYDGTGCHRIIAGFVVQCGRPGEDETAPGYTIADELPEPGDYAEGVVAMANTGAPDSAGGQWFVITGEQGAALPPSYTVLGTVVDGYDTTVRALANLADPTAPNGVPPLAEVVIESVTITEG